ncbi:fumarylacetoacetate hydrolase family protein [Aulographum hederae CBS 113979]|uniref:Fumarylacetoacetate hydrolase family protein n=1 Tax=Aulographum hederae CBS 113979 TaxID=1176131 RepID=A0A6G1GNC0_9PEZI|nr:fumarylacetoacetate hydrolase family protein [Aulographum hederae CBS 113979]
MSWTRLIRFVAKDTKTYYGNAILPPGTTDIGKARSANIINGSPWSSNYIVTDRIAEITHLLPPIALADCTTLRCLGLNYRAHAVESNLPIPKSPILFYKPGTALAAPFSDIPVPFMAQEHDGLDYECELVVVIGRDAKDVSEEEALDYVAGYCVGNDVSHRAWQIELGGGQWSLGKGFDGWAPLGPGIVSTALIPDPSKLRIQTRVNGETMQDSNTKDLIFGVKETLSFLSGGTTLRAGDVIFTGTPQGVGMGRNPKLWLKDGDFVEVELEGVGTCGNKVVFEKGKAKL